MLKSALVLLPLAAGALLPVQAQSLHVHAGAVRDSLAFADLDSIAFADITADDATLLAYTKTGSKTWKTKAVDSLKVKPAPQPPDTGIPDLGLRWMFLGDSQTGGRASGEVLSHVTAFRAIWDKSFPTLAGEQATIDGVSGRRLASTAEYYGGSSARTDRTWVHFQESGGQDGAGQTTAAEFGATWEAFVRKIKAESPNAIISTETAFSFGREDESGRDWDPYNAVLREKLALVAKDGIKVRLAEVDRNVKALDALVGGVNVWFQSSETNAYHYKGLGNLLVALSIFDAMGYNVDALDLSGITSVTADQKAKCLEIIKKF
jgi:hypothetical protein